MSIKGKIVINLRGIVILPVIAVLAACSPPTITGGDIAAIKSGYGEMIESLSDNTARQKGFELALYRAVTPVEFVAPPDNFDGREPLKLAVLRADMPAPGSDAYFEVVSRNAGQIAGMDAATIVDKYVSQDGALLSKQEQWARGWQTRRRIKSRNDAEEVQRRRRLLAQFSARQAAYSWEGGKPVLKFTMRNPLDIPLDRIEVDLDLFDPGGQKRVGSARVQGVLRTALQPEAVASVQIDLSQYEQVARRELRNFAETLNVQLVFRNAWSREKSLIFAEHVTDKEFNDQNSAVIDLLSEIQLAKQNLSKFRITFADR
ncbi:hypothetical protein GCM10019059_36710 [Camelimonas fluminis]|nr:hypothetical protein GCM10019059_36710 [Camelimonas fluminis]